MYSGHMALVTCFLALLIGNQTAAPVQNQVSLRFNPPVGKTYQFKMTVKMQMGAVAGGPAMEFQTDMDSDMKVVSRTGDVTTMETKFSKAHVTLPEDSPIAAMKESLEKQSNDKTVTSKIDGFYHVQGVNGSGMDSMINGMQAMSFPDHAIKVGDDWSYSMDLGKMIAAGGNAVPGAPSVEASGKIPIKFRLKEITQKGNQTFANIEITMDGDAKMSVSGQEIEMHIKSTGTQQIEVSTGMTVGTSMVSDTTSTFGDMKMTQHLVQSMVLR